MNYTAMERYAQAPVPVSCAGRAQRGGWMTRSEATVGVLAAIGMAVVAMVSVTARAADRGEAQIWVASWASSMHGPYPFGNGSAQPVLDFAIENADTGARDQTLRQ